MNWSLRKFAYSRSAQFKSFLSRFTNSEGIRSHKMTARDGASLKMTAGVEATTNNKQVTTDSRQQYWFHSPKYIIQQLK